MLEHLALENWNGPYDAGMKARAVSALESGAVLFFPNLAFVLPDAEKRFLKPSVSDGKAKNISLDHTTGKMQASSLTGEAAKDLAAMQKQWPGLLPQLITTRLPWTEYKQWFGPHASGIKTTLEISR